MELAPCYGALWGLLLGIKDNILEIERWLMGEHYLGAELRNRKTNFRWSLLVVYGSAQHDFSRNFLDELNSFLSNYALPCVIGGDFNLIRCVEDKSNGQEDKNLMEAFNIFIENNQPRELQRVGSRFTCTNKQSNPIKSNIDRVLMMTEWEKSFPLSTLSSLPRLGSDHCPLLLDFGDTLKMKPRNFTLKDTG